MDYIKKLLDKINRIIDKETRASLVKPILLFVLIMIIIIGSFLIYGIYKKYKEYEYTEFSKRISKVRNKIIAVYNKEEQFVGININQIDDSKQYKKCKKAIPKIEEKYNINLNSGDYYFVFNKDKEKIGINDVIGEYIVNYKTTEVYSIKPIKYKGVKYYTILQIEYYTQKIIDYRYPYIPDGFRYSEGEWDTGFVIKDDNENEFVWIPVGYLNNEKPSSVLKKYYRDYNVDTMETEEYKKIINSIDKYKGFYIGRYEASLQGATENSSQGNNNILQVVKNVLPISQMSFSTQENNNVLSVEEKRTNGYGNGGNLKPKVSMVYKENGEMVEKVENDVKGAIELARDMSDNYIWGKNNVHSALIYSEQYDTALKIIDGLGYLRTRKKDGQDPIKEDSTLLGNYMNRKITYILNNEEVVKESMEAQLLPTGAEIVNKDENLQEKPNEIFNIYDLAGNLGEWTVDTRLNKYISVRGGSFSNKGNMPPISEYVKQIPTDDSNSIGIRVVLYID